MSSQDTKPDIISHSPQTRSRSLSGSIKNLFKLSSSSQINNGPLSKHASDRTDNNTLPKIVESKKDDLILSKEVPVSSNNSPSSKYVSFSSDEEGPVLQRVPVRKNTVKSSSKHPTSPRYSSDGGNSTEILSKVEGSVNTHSSSSRDASRKSNSAGLNESDSSDNTNRHIDSILSSDSKSSIQNLKLEETVTKNKKNSIHPPNHHVPAASNKVVNGVNESQTSAKLGKSLSRNNSFKIPSLFKSTNASSNGNTLNIGNVSDISRSNSLSGVYSPLSRKNSISLQPRKTKPHSDTISVGSLQPEDNRGKCILQVENFKVFENGSHEHNLNIMQVIRPYIDNGHDEASDNSAHETHDNVKQRSAFSLISMFKSHKNEENLANIQQDQTVDNELKNAFSLISSHTGDIPKVVCTSDVSDSETQTTNSHDIKDSNNKNDLGELSNKIVNEHAAIGVTELKLINELSERINKALSGKISDASQFNRNNKATFEQKFGKSVGVVLGHGSYGTVRLFSKDRIESDPASFQSYCDNKKIFFAVKELKPRSNEHKDKFTTRITSEFIIGHSLSHSKNRNGIVRCHPNIVKIIDLMEVSNTSFIEVLEFCPAGDLYSILIAKSKSGMTLNPLEADCFMKQLLTGIQFMHIHGVAHCDLKPENLLFHSNGLLKICDFGTSCVFQTAWEKTAHFQSGIVGSEPYVAPEEFIHGNEYDPRLVDCWSAGVIYCSMVLGHYLWKLAVPEKDSLYKSFCTEMNDSNEFYVFEEMKHINHEINRLRKMTLYKIFQIDPSKRITIDQALGSAWMRNTNCCIHYKRSI
ncbi:hypothetical protein TPHA_0A02770 [Tetrapisispora phaffii CBS 4417]|uniref:non-specific serine/threonine protein kinase n=1 Tax=Tetrapisispora phaffii (strain ATCC 24235 / CBS 4417 / NBRC 1672 / NRRL Y-8282 / UCD 70-5) TaxID=1071381 RepID=G8BN81_TETPH|nr:hypothetical protein TPHA_0A02770 [Tetrapisispora phaffii CBS 4417]CCE61359.1 hypothetical protein TPHA_0A02770 [Tetrapisispora phaffii CBS 4417]